MNSKIIRVVLGLFLLIGGIGAGINLVGQNQDIRSRASCMSRCTAEADECEAICGRQDGADSQADYGSTSDQQSGSRTSDSAPSESFPASYKGDTKCGGKCTTNQTCVQFNTSGYYYCKIKPVISYTPPPVIIPTPRGTPIPITRDVAVNSYNFTPNTVGYDCSRGGCGAGSGAVSGFYETFNGSGIYRAIGGTGNVPYYEEEVNRAIQVAQDLQEKDELAYEQYRLDQLAEEQARIIKEQNEARVEQVRLDRIVAEAEIAKAEELEQARIAQADTITELLQNSSRSTGVTSNPFAETNKTPVYDFATTPTKTDSNPFLTTSNYTGVTQTDSIPTIQEIFDFTPLGKVMNAINNPITYNDAFFDTGVTGDIIKTAMQDMADTYTFGKFNPYVDAFQPDKVAIQWQQAGYSSLDACIDDLGSKYGRNGAASCNTYTPTKDQIDTSTDLGIYLTEVGYAPIAIGNVAAATGSRGLLGAAGTLFQQGGIMSFTSQAPTALSTCFDENGNLNASSCSKEDFARAAITLASLGTSNAVNISNTFLNRAANSVVSAGNLLIDSGDAYDTCAGNNKNTFGCGLSSFALIADIAGVGFDYKSNQLLSLGDVSLIRNTPLNLTQAVTSTDMLFAPKVNEIPTSRIVADIFEDEFYNRLRDPIFRNGDTGISNTRVDNDLTVALNQLSDSPHVNEVEVPFYEAPPRRTFSQWADDTIVQPIGDALFGNPIPRDLNIPDAPRNPVIEQVNDFIARNIFDGNQLFPRLIPDANLPARNLDNSVSVDSSVKMTIAFEQDLPSTNLNTFDPEIRVRFQGTDYPAISIAEAEEIARRLTGEEIKITDEMHITEPKTLRENFDMSKPSSDDIADTLTPSQPTTATTLAGNLMEGFNNITDAGTRVWNDWIAGPVNKMVNNFMTNPPANSLTSRVEDVSINRITQINLDETPLVKVKIGDTIIVGSNRVTLTEGMGLGSNYDSVIRITTTETEINLRENHLVFLEKDPLAQTPREQWTRHNNISQPASQTSKGNPYVITLESRIPDVPSPTKTSPLARVAELATVSNLKGMNIGAGIAGGLIIGGDYVLEKTTGIGLDDRLYLLFENLPDFPFLVLTQFL